VSDTDRPVGENTKPGARSGSEGVSFEGLGSSRAAGTGQDQLDAEGVAPTVVLKRKPPRAALATRTLFKGTEHLAALGG